MAVYEMSISVRTQYLEEQSEPDRSHYVFAYAVTIKNTGSVPDQLIARHWVIADAGGKLQEVSGLGVVGHQPLLQPAPWLLARFLKTGTRPILLIAQLVLLLTVLVTASRRQLRF